MTDSPRFETALEISPLTVLVRGVLEWACPHAFFEELFDRECRPRPWNRQLTISALAWLMLAVVTGVRRSVFAAFVADRAAGAPTILATAAALYAKYGRIDPRFTVAVVRAAGARMRALLEAAGVRETFGWEGYRVTILDGTDLAGTDHRLTPPRRINAAGLPGRYVAAYDLATGLVVDAAASEDAYTSERALVRGLLRVAVLDQLFVADRHFCTTDILFRIIDRGARFVIREHGNNLRRHPVEAARAVGRVETGAVWEQAIEAEDTTSGQRPAAADAADHPGARCAHRGRGDGGRPVEQPGAGQPAADLCPVPRPLDDRAPLRADQGGAAGRDRGAGPSAGGAVRAGAGDGGGQRAGGGQAGVAGHARRGGVRVAVGLLPGG